MKKLTLIILSFCLTMTFSIYAQDYSYREINEIESASVSSYTYGGGGYAVTATGSLKVLIIFAEFPDDRYDTTNTRWVKGSAPANMSSWVDATWSSSPTQGSLTHYFNVMSLNNLHITGETMHVIAPRTRKQYATATPIMDRGAIQKEIIQSIDATTDFSSFDQWEKTSDYTFINEPETPIGQVDMIMFIWRNTSSDSSKYKSLLGFTSSFGSLGGSSFTVDSGARTINTYDYGSGITVISYVGSDTYDNDPFRITIHEFAHYLLGHNNMHNGYGFWGMLCDWGTRSYVINAFERYQLGWINSPTTYTVNANTTTASTLTSQTLDDFITNGHAYRVTVNSSTNEYFYLENHQNTNYWETHSPFSDHPNSIDGNVETGLYVIKQKGMTNTNNTSNRVIKFAKEMVPAYGRYTWNVVSSLLNPYDNVKILPVWYKGAPNRTTGYHDLEMVTHSYSYTNIQNPSAISFVRDTTTHNNLYPEYYLGKGKDAFRVGYNQVFSPWSNPNNQRASDDTTRFGFEITGFSSNTYTMNLYVNSSMKASPAKVRNFKRTSDQYHPTLTWDLNAERDIASYRIYRKYDGSLGIAGTVGRTVSTFVDTLVDYTKPIWAVDIEYYVVAVDSTSKVSVPSDTVETTGYMEYSLEKQSEITDSNIESESLSNYPNPFNPSTRISFSIPNNGHVSLKVYDILGREVAVLANRVLEAGQYEYNFNGENLASGTYIYCLRTNNKTITKKMLLIK